jgi:hypothetical protein
MPRGRPRKRPRKQSSSESDVDERELVTDDVIVRASESSESDAEWLVEDAPSNEEDEDEVVGKSTAQIDINWTTIRKWDAFATCDEPKPPLVLPSASADLHIEAAYVLDAAAVYETLRRFRMRLRLTPFLFEGKSQRRKVGQPAILCPLPIYPRPKLTYHFGKFSCFLTFLVSKPVTFTPVFLCAA